MFDMLLCRYIATQWSSGNHVIQILKPGDNWDQLIWISVNYHISEDLKFEIEKPVHDNKNGEFHHMPVLPSSTKLFAILKNYL